MNKIETVLWDSSVTGERDRAPELKDINFTCNVCGERIYYERENMMEADVWKNPDKLTPWYGNYGSRYFHAKEPCITTFYLSVL